MYIVWFSKTLQNWKAIVGSTVADSRLYEVTYDGENKRTYIDVYVKQENVIIHDNEINWKDLM